MNKQDEYQILQRLMPMVTLLQCIAMGEETSIDTDGAEPAEIAQQVLNWANLTPEMEEYILNS